MRQASLKSFFVFLIGFFCIASSTAHADSIYGLTMHGTPEHSASDTYLSYANPDAPKGGTLKMEAIGTFDTLNPYAIKGQAAKGLHLTYDRLMARSWNEPFTLYPLIAERIEVPDDRSSLIIHINPKARFHDNTPITADDVIFSFETLRDHGRPNMRRIYGLVEKAERTGLRTVHFSFGKDYNQETVMILAMMPIISQNWWKDKIFDKTILATPITNGPYRIKNINPGKFITYERVTDYWAADILPNKGHYNFDKITYDYFRDKTVAFESFKVGDIDLHNEYDIGRWESSYDFPDIKNAKTLRETFAHGRAEKVRALIYNTRRAPFDDIRVRKALNLLFDFEWVNKNIFYGHYKRIDSYFPNTSLASQGTPSPAELSILTPWKDEIPNAVFGPSYVPPSAKNLKQKRYNMRIAARLLEEAGWIITDGKRIKNGTPLSFEILLGTPEDEKIALHFKRDLEKAGITINIRALDSAAFTGRLNDYDFDMTLYFWHSTLSPGTEQMLYWSCESAEIKSRWNFAGICNPAIDDIATKIANTKDRETLTSYTRALDRILTHSHYAIPLYYSGADNIAFKNTLKHPQKTPLYGPVLETWWMDHAQNTNQD